MSLKTRWSWQSGVGIKSMGCEVGTGILTAATQRMTGRPTYEVEWRWLFQSPDREKTGKVREGYSFSGSSVYGLRRMSPGKSKHSGTGWRWNPGR